MSENELIPNLSHQEVQRYSRHLILPEVGYTGQQKLKKARVLLIGAGGLGSPLALYLAAAGIGTLGIVDFDVVDYTNLQRQILHSTANVGQSKLKSAKDRIAGLNPEVNVITFEESLTSDNALRIIKDFDIVVDGTDNFPTRYLVSDACVMLGKPNVYGSIFRFDGQLSVFDSTKGPCYRCLYSEPPPPGLVPSCAEGGVLGVLPGIVGTMQANEVIKLILGIGKPLIGRLLLIDALDMSFRELKLRKNPNCVICGPNPSVTELIDYAEFCGVGTDAPPALSSEEIITPLELAEIIDSQRSIQIIDVREPHEAEISKIKGSILIPVDKIGEPGYELDRDSLIILHCRSGIRSARALAKLKAYGFSNLKNLQGGINAWATQVDPSLPTY